MGQIELLGIAITVLLMQLGFVDWLDDWLARREQERAGEQSDE